MGSYRMQLIVSVYFIQCFKDESMLWLESVFLPFYFYGISLCIFTTGLFFVVIFFCLFCFVFTFHLWVDIWNLFSFQLLQNGIEHSHISLCVDIYFYPCIGINMLYDKGILNFTKNFQIVLQSSLMPGNYMYHSCSLVTNKWYLKPLKCLPFQCVQVPY